MFGYHKVVILIRIAIIPRIPKLFSTSRVSSGDLQFLVTISVPVLIRYRIALPSRYSIASPCLAAAAAESEPLEVGSSGSRTRPTGMAPVRRYALRAGASQRECPASFICVLSVERKTPTNQTTQVERSSANTRFTQQRPFWNGAERRE